MVTSSPGLPSREQILLFPGQEHPRMNARRGWRILRFFRVSARPNGSTA